MVYVLVEVLQTRYEGDLQQTLLVCSILQRTMIGSCIRIKVSTNPRDALRRQTPHEGWAYMKVV